MSYGKRPAAGGRGRSATFRSSPTASARRRRGRLRIAGGAQIGLAHGGKIDLAEQGLQRLLQRLIVGALRRQQHDRVIGRDRMLVSSSTTRSYFAIRPSLV